MYTTTVRSVAPVRFLEKGSHNVRMRQLVGREDGARHTSVHELIFGKGGYSVAHAHKWEHELVVTSGRGVAIVDGRRIELRPGVVLLVQGDEEHQFLQRGTAALRFLTVTPV
ncbi:MAG TPA: cupin domain-containing protein [Thermoplasmata archaeon]|nr:cupin domain-containing protein [Thermoplasmata archaeon]